MTGNKPRIAGAAERRMSVRLGAEIAGVGARRTVSGGKPVRIVHTMVVDDSSSIDTAGNTMPVCRGHNAMLAACGRGDSPEGVLVQTRFLTDSPLSDRVPLAAAPLLGRGNYRPVHGTPLYAAMHDTLLAVERETEALSGQFDVYTITCLFTDGEDTGSLGMTAQHVKDVIARMEASGRHIVFGIGLRNGRTDFAAVFRDMGIPEARVRVLEREKGDIVQGMASMGRVVSQTVDGASFMRSSILGFAAVVPDVVPRPVPPPPMPRPSVSPVMPSVVDGADAGPARPGLWGRLKGLVRWPQPPPAPVTVEPPPVTSLALLADATEYTNGERPRLRIDLRPLLSRTGEATIQVRRNQERQALSVTEVAPASYVVDVPAHDNLYSRSGAVTLRVSAGEVTVQNPSQLRLTIVDPATEEELAVVESNGAGRIPANVSHVELRARTTSGPQALARIDLPGVHAWHGYAPPTDMGRFGSEP